MFKFDTNEIKLDIRKLLDYTLSHFCILVGLSTLAGYSFLRQFDIVPSASTSDTVLLAFSFTIALFLLNFSDKVKGDLEKIDTSLVKSNENIRTSLVKANEDMKVNLERIDASLKANEDTAKVQIIDSSEDLYRVLKEKIKGAKHEVRIMHLDPHSPDLFGNETRSDYFKFFFDFAEEHRNITMKRITSIVYKDKGEWLLNKMNETKHLDKLSMAYINTGDLEDLEVSLLKTVVSCEIIDNDKVFILNPLSNTVANEFDKCVYIENKKVAETYIAYYDKLWNIAQLKHHGCRIIKAGTTCDFAYVKHIIDSLPENPRSESQLSQRIQQDHNATSYEENNTTYINTNSQAISAKTMIET